MSDSFFNILFTIFSPKEIMTTSVSTRISQVDTSVTSSSQGSSSINSSEELTSQESHGEHTQPNIVLQTMATYSEILRHQVYHPAPVVVRNVPTYVLQWLVQMNEHNRSEHVIRDATIGLVAEVGVQETLSLLIGGVPAGAAMFTASVVERLEESPILPSMEQIGE